MASVEAAVAQFQAKLLARKDLRDATAIAENDFAAAHSELSAADPNNPMLAMDLDELANSLSGVMISPFAAILEIYFGTNEKGPARGGGGVGVGLAGPAALPTGDIVRRIAGGTGLER